MINKKTTCTESFHWSGTHFNQTRQIGTCFTERYAAPDRFLAVFHGDVVRAFIVCYSLLFRLFLNLLFGFARNHVHVE